jgi:exopolyphosphatase / guanosine-5'-triphosphate,3'-diphosphate pyrophosphatase
MRRYAGIDIGTNTVLMAVADIAEGGTLVPVYDGQRIPRLGSGVDRTGSISDDALRRSIDAVRFFKREAERLNVDAIFACGTSALRDAANRDAVVGAIRDETGIDVEIASGEMEAEYTYRGALSAIPRPLHPIGVLDIGGGSTELVTGLPEGVIVRTSIDAGCVRMTERFFPALPPSERHLNTAEDYIRGIAARACNNVDIASLVGVAGTLTTLAAMDLNLDAYRSDVIDSHVLSIDTVDTMFSTFAAYTLDQMKRIRQVAEGREDILLAGVLILKIYMDLLGRREIAVSTRGLRYGLILSHADVA